MYTEKYTDNYTEKFEEGILGIQVDSLINQSTHESIQKSKKIWYKEGVLGIQVDSVT